MITTNYSPPPIPDRRFDWTAITDNYEGGDPIGYGTTEAEAIADLQDQLPRTGTRIGHMEECGECRGTGQAPYSHLRCRQCHGAGEIEVWNDDEENT